MKRVHKAVLLYIAANHEAKIRDSSVEVEILQHVEGKGYLASDGKTTVLIETTETRYADGDKVNASIEAAGETYAYTTVMGAKKTVHVVRPLSMPDLPDLVMFVQQLKSGKTFTIIQGEREERCENCGGFGKGRMVNGRYEPCSCRDVGIWKRPNYYTITW